MKRILSVAFLAITLPAHAGPWHGRVDAQMLIVSVPQSTSTKEITDTGLRVGAEYMDRIALALGADEIRVSQGGTADLDYTTLHLSGQYHLYADALAGRVTTRLDGYQMGSGTREITTGTGEAGLALLSWLEYGRRIGLELGGGSSRYPDLKVRQWTGALGFMPYSRSDWITMRAIQLRYSSPDLALGETEREAYELRWTHTFAVRRLGMESIWIDLKGGERLYYIDPDSRSITNRPDRLREAIALGTQWSPGAHWKLLVGASAERVVVDDEQNRTGRFAYLDLVYHW